MVRKTIEDIILIDNKSSGHGIQFNLNYKFARKNNKIFVHNNCRNAQK